MSAEPFEPRLVWVLVDAPRRPGLLMEWRQGDGGWEGRVVFPDRTPTGWGSVEAWVPANQLVPRDDDGTGVGGPA